MSKVNGREITLELSELGVTYKSLVCEISSGLNMTTSSNNVETKCDPIALVTTGATSAEIPFEAIAETEPSTTEVSIDEVLAWVIAKTKIFWRYKWPTASGAGLYRQGQGYITDYNETHNIGDFVQFTGTLKVDGSIDITA